jgi:tetratricopeptide (TPR) repeat protein
MDNQPSHEDPNSNDIPEALEAAIRHLLEANKPEEALDLLREHYQLNRVSGYANLGLHQGRFRTGLRLCELFASDEQGLSEHQRDPFFYDRALYLIDLGELDQAEAILRDIVKRVVNLIYPGILGKSQYQWSARLGLFDIAFLQGELMHAQSITEAMIRAHESDDIVEIESYVGSMAQPLADRVRIGEAVGGYCYTTGYNPYARRALIRTIQGDVPGAFADFKKAEQFQQDKLGDGGGMFALHGTKRMLLLAKQRGKDERLSDEESDEEWKQIEAFSDKVFPLLGHSVVHYGMLLTRLGKLNTAQSVLDYTHRWAAHPENCYPLTQACASLALSDVYRLQGEPQKAHKYLAAPMQWSEETGHREIACWSMLCLARLQLLQQKIDDAEQSIQETLQMADTHGFQLYHIDGLISGGRIALLQGDWAKFNERVLPALYAASDPHCGYAWAHGNALHLLAERSAHSERLDEAKTLLQGAIRIRERIQDPRVHNSRQLLYRLSPKRGCCSKIMVGTKLIRRAGQVFKWTRR